MLMYIYIYLNHFNLIYKNQFNLIELSICY